MTAKTRTGTSGGTLYAAEQAFAKVQQQYHTVQVQVAQLTRELRALDVEPETWTGVLLSERAASKRNLTRASSQAQQELHALQRGIEAAKANLQQLRARAKELPGLIERLTFDLTREGRYGRELYRAEQTVIIVQNQLTSQHQALARLEAEQQALVGE